MFDSMKKFFSKNKRSLVSSESGITMIFIMMFIALSFLSPVFFSFTNIFNVLRQVSTDAITSFGQLLVIISGGIDLSVGSITALTAVVVSKLLLGGMNSVLAVLLTCIIGSMLGAFNGILVSKGKLAPFIATLGTMTIVRGICYVITHGLPVNGMSDKFFKFIGAGYIYIIPFPVIISLFLFMLIGFLLKSTRFGRHVYAVGSNIEAARRSGITIDRVRIIVYTLSGLMATIAGIILSSKLDAGVPQMGYGAELDSIAAVVMGGASLAGGSGSVFGTLIGALIVGLLRNGLNLLEIYPYWQNVAIGIVIILAVLIGQIIGKKHE